MVTGKIIQVILAELNRDYVQSVKIWASTLSQSPLLFFMNVQTGLVKAHRHHRHNLKDVIGEKVPTRSDHNLGYVIC